MRNSVIVITCIIFGLFSFGSSHPTDKEIVGENDGAGSKQSLEVDKDANSNNADDNQLAEDDRDEKEEIQPEEDNKENKEDAEESQNPDNDKDEKNEDSKESQQLDDDDKKKDDTKADEEQGQQLDNEKKENAKADEDENQQLDDDKKEDDAKTEKDEDQSDEDKQAVVADADEGEDQPTDDKKQENNAMADEVQKSVTSVKLSGDADDTVNQTKLYEALQDAGNPAELFGTNQHYYVPSLYEDLGRRLLHRPYNLRKSIINDEAERKLDNTINEYLQNVDKRDKTLKPVKAPPEVVLRIARQSAILEASKPRNPTEDIIKLNALRTGEYWDDVWREDVDPRTLLRSSNNYYNIESLKIEVEPGSRLYELVSALRQVSPRLLYVINYTDDGL